MGFLQSHFSACGMYYGAPDYSEIVPKRVPVSHLSPSQKELIANVPTYNRQQVFTARNSVLKAFACSGFDVRMFVLADARVSPKPEILEPQTAILEQIRTV